MQPLLRFLTTTGVGSRRVCFKLIVDGRVRVNGHLIEDTTTPVEPDDIVKVNGRVVRGLEQKAYLKLNKPRGIISTTSDEHGRRMVTDLIPRQYTRLRLFPVGRLDAQSTGLVLLTNDGDLAFRLSHPRFEVEKEYLVTLEAPLTDGQQHALERGVDIGGEHLTSAKVKSLPATAGLRYSLVIHEGRNHHVRRMLKSVGREVMNLHRVRIHSLMLGRLPTGEVEELTTDEVRKLFKDLPEIEAEPKQQDRPTASLAPRRRPVAPRTRPPGRPPLRGRKPGATGGVHRSRRT